MIKAKTKHHDTAERLLRGLASEFNSEELGELGELAWAWVDSVCARDSVSPLTPDYSQLCGREAVLRGRFAAQLGQFVSDASDPLPPSQLLADQPGVTPEGADDD